MRISPILELALGAGGSLGAVAAWIGVWWSGKKQAAAVVQLGSELEEATTTHSLSVQRLQNELRKLDSEVAKVRAELEAADRKHMLAVSEMQAQRKKSEDEDAVNRALLQVLREDADQQKRSFSVIKKRVPLEDEPLREALRRIGARQLWTKGNQPEELWGLPDEGSRS